MLKEEIDYKLSLFLKEYNECLSKEDKSNLLIKHNMKDQLAKIPTLWGRRNTAKNGNRWDSINLRESDNSKPMLICLSGNGTKSFKEANGFCKRAEKMLELMFEGRQDSTNPEDFIDIIGCSYGGAGHYFRYQSPEVDEMYSSHREYIVNFPQSTKAALETKRSGGCPGVITEEEVNEFVDKLMVSRCVKNGKKCSVDECCKNMSQIIFFTYCYGAEALDSIMKTFDQRLMSLGFEKDAVETIKNSMSHISFARKQYTRDIPTICFYAVDDNSIGVIPNVRNYMGIKNCNLLQNLAKQGKETYGQHFSPNRYSATSLDCECLEFVYKGLGNNINAIVDQAPDHAIGNIDRDADWNIINKDNTMLDCVSQMMSWALCRAVENGLQNAKSDSYIPKMSMEGLREELMSIYRSFAQEDLMIKE